MSSKKLTYGTFFEFEKDDIFHNRIKTFPKVQFLVYSGSVYYNNENQRQENPDIPNGFLSLYDINVNRQAHSASGDDQLIKSFVTKNGSFQSFKTISTDSFNLDFVLGDKLEHKYPLTASISIDTYDSSLSTAKASVLYALKNTLNHYKTLSPHYAYSSSYGEKENQPLNLISIPSIFYGSSIKKGSIYLRFYVTGSLVGEASDINRDGRIIQTTGSSTGQAIGVALYNEGFLLLTSSAAITTTHTEQYKKDDADLYNPSWQYFANTSSYNSISSSYSIEMKGLNYVETLTMFAHAKENQLNFSNNPTFTEKLIVPISEQDIYHEDSQTPIKNIVSSSYKNYSASFANTTYISKIGIYDENKNLIAIAGVATPVKKIEERAYTFKLKLDI
jgi:hypothetical protein